MHSATKVDADDRAHLERLCRYVARPPLAAGRLERISDDELSFRLKTPWDDGTTHLILSLKNNNSCSLKRSTIAEFAVDYVHPRWVG